MYKSFFALDVKPFDLLPNPEFLFLSASHKRALVSLEYAVRDQSGFILLTGEIGSGKTTLLRDLFNRHSEGVVLARIFNTRVDFEQLLAMINDNFGLPAAGSGKVALLRELNRFLTEVHAKGNRAILVIDKAQNLTPEILEELRLLSNLETDCVKLLHIVLVGQPELRETLALPALLQLRQRISCFCHLLPLQQGEVEPYILHRLERAGNRGAVDFSPESIELIWNYSRGIPRLVNTICDFLLLLAYADGQRTMTAQLTRTVVVDLDFENCYWGRATVPESASETTRDDSRATLSELLVRVARLEKTELPVPPSHPPAAGRSEDMESYIQHLVAATCRVPQGAGDAVQAPPGPSRPAPRPAGFKRWFRFLYRAA